MASKISVITLLSFNREKIYELIFVAIIMAILVLFVKTAFAKQNVPAGLSDTATTRAWDDALKKITPDEDIDFRAGHDTPTADQLFTWFLNYSDVSDTKISVDGTGQDTTAWKNDEIPYRLIFLEVYASDGSLDNYTKKVTSDTFGQLR